MSGFDVEAIERIQETYAEASAPKFLVPPVGNGREFYVWNASEGTLEHRQASPAPIKIDCSSLMGLVQTARLMHQRFPGMVVWCGETEVVLRLDPADPRWKAGVALLRSDAWALISSGKLIGLSQQELVNKLRGPLKGKVLDAAFVPMVRQLRFTRNRDTEAELSVGRESMGAKILAEVFSAAGSVPEEIELQVDVYSPELDVITKTRVEAQVYIDLENCKFTLTVEQEIVRARERWASAVVAAWLRENLPAVPVIETAEVAE
jgi:hypothetical protein